MFNLEDLPYAYNALEPHIDEQTMRIHHDKHHAGYVSNLNKALEGRDDLLKLDINELVADFSQVPEDLETTVRNNGGGHANHSLFWKVMTANGGGKPKATLLDAINSKFTNFDSFKQKFTEAALTRFGSGWAWLIINDGVLGVISTKNQDSPLIDGATPILGLDVWEHAYYLKYQNRRAEYIEAWWNVVNWDQVSKNFISAINKYK